jgi:hypothetical protein
MLKGKPFKISYAGNAWKCVPAHGTVPHSDGLVVFNLGLSAGKTGCRVCFADSSVFGIPYVDLFCKSSRIPIKSGEQTKTTFNIQDATAPCPSLEGSGRADPYDVTIGSGLPGAGKKSKKTPDRHKK